MIHIKCHWCAAPAVAVYGRHASCDSCMASTVYAASVGPSEDDPADAPRAVWWLLVVLWIVGGLLTRMVL